MERSKPSDSPTSPRLLHTSVTHPHETMDLHRELVDRANADLKAMALEPNPSKRAWLGGRAQVLLTVANAIRDDSLSVEALAAAVDALISKAAEEARIRGREEDAQYEFGRVAGLNTVRRLLRRT